MDYVHAQKPSFQKTFDAQLFQELRQKVNETVSVLESERKPEITVKAILFPLLYITFYASALLWGSNTYVLYGCYAMLGFCSL